jgi:hypothetical protein
MFWRWLIRGSAVALLALCVAAWGVSYWRGVQVWYQSKRGTSYGMGCEWGRLYYFNSLVHLSMRPGWQIGREPAYDWTGQDASANFMFLGFTFSRPGHFYEVTIPLWFCTALSAALLFLLWRRTGSRYIGKGFSVEAGGAKGER